MNNAIQKLTEIVQEVALVDSPSEQVQLLVDSISDSIAIDVCSLYRLNENSEMVLLASHGLASSENVRIPAGKGLVGLVARSRHPVNLADAASHPDFFYIPRTEEEKFRSFCGVPLVHYGDVIGVLVVQSRLEQQLSDEAEAFLVTLASQLALIIGSIPASKTDMSAINLRAVGIKGAPGIGVGLTRLCITNELDNVPDAECDDIDAAIQQWHALKASVKEDIAAEQAALGGKTSDSISAIFDSYQMLLASDSLTQKVESEIRAGHWLPGALRLSIHYFSEMFRAMDDPYLKARYEDIQHLGNKLYNAWRGNHPQQEDIPPGQSVVLVSAQVSVSDIANVPTGQLAGIVCFEGSSLSHTSVLASAMGVPAVMGMGSLKGLQSNELIIVDGNEGQVILHPSDMVADEFRNLIHEEALFRKQLDTLRDQPAETTDGVRIRMFANTGLLADITPGLKNGAEGVGLYRTEIPFMVRDSFPSEDEQLQVYERVFAAYVGKPVYMRTLDIGGDKHLPYFPIGHEENPALGWRGIRFTLDNIQLLMTQVRAMIRAADDSGDLHILLPMITSTGELDKFRELLADACDQLSTENQLIQPPKVGVMIEVPAAISQIHVWKDKIDFISIGSNDLSQYLLALDRNNARVASRYDHVHPAVLHEINRVVEIAKHNKLPLSICGEMSSDPVAVALLLGMGVRQLSMSAAKLPRIKWLIRSVSIDQMEELLDQALLLDKVEAIRSLVTDALADAGLNELLNKRK